MDKKSEQWFRRGAFFVVLSLVVHAFVAWWARTSPDLDRPLFFAARSTFFEPFKRLEAQRPSMPVQPMERVDEEGAKAAPPPDWVPQAPAPVDTVRPPQARTLSDALLNPQKEDFKAGRTADLDLDSLTLAADIRSREALEQYARLYMADADTTDVESQQRRQARQIVERAIRVMGGRERLRALRTKRVRVWVEAWEHVIEFPPPPRVLNLGAYVYPAVEWDYRFTRDARAEFRSESVEMDKANPLRARNPSISLRSFASLFQYRWLFFRSIDQQIYAKRLEGEVERWHFLDRFLGDGIVLHHLGQHSFAGQQADVVRVDDRRYGHLLNAYFARARGLLLGVREGLIASEGASYSARYQKRPPLWTTVYEKYKRVCGVLQPHRIRRTGPACPHCYGREESEVIASVQLQVACNEKDLGDETPTLESWAP